MLVLLAACATDSGVKGQNDTSTPDGLGTLSLASPTLVWTDMAAGFSETRDLDVTNTGTGDLTVYNASIVEDLDDAFDFTEVESLVVPAGTTSTWSVRATLPTDVAVYGTLRIRTDDAADDSVDVPLCAFPTGAEATCP